MYKIWSIHSDVTAFPACIKNVTISSIKNAAICSTVSDINDGSI